MTKPEPQNIYAFGIPSAAIMGTPTVTVRSYLTSQHLWTARREAWLCRRREDELVGTNDANVFYRHHSHAITAVLSAVAFLEAFIKARAVRFRVATGSADQHVVNGCGWGT
jgi:hypothetical protein